MKTAKEMRWREAKGQAGERSGRMRPQGRGREFFLKNEMIRKGETGETNSDMRGGPDGNQVKPGSKVQQRNLKYK